MGLAQAARCMLAVVPELPVPGGVEVCVSPLQTVCLLAAFLQLLLQSSRCVPALVCYLLAVAEVKG